MRISAVITTLNEAPNIADAVASALRMTPDVLVIDSGSDDGTQAIARALGARVIERAFDDMASQRNAALKDGALSGEYALFLDADERITPPFESALVGLLEARPELDGVRICRKLHFWGRWVPAASSYPRYIDRVVRVGHVFFKKEGHGEVFDGGNAFERLAEPLHDEDKKPMSAWIDRHNRYAAMEAKRDVALTTGDKALSSPHWWRAQMRRLPGFPVAMGAYYLVARKGLFEGPEGRSYSVMKAMYEYFVQLHTRDLERRKKGL